MRKSTVGLLIDRFLADTQTTAAPATYKWYAGFLRSLRTYCGELRADKLTASTARSWINERYSSSSQNSRNAAARCICRLVNWSLDERLLDVSPLRGFRKPRAVPREAVLTPAQYAVALRHARGPMRDVVKFLWHTGCRPGELRLTRGEWIDGRKIVLPLEDSKGRRRRRVVYLDKMAAVMAARLKIERPRGPIFRNSRGTPWRKDGLALAFCRLRERSGVAGLCAYALRHAWITRMLEKGVDVATVAAMAGNSPRMVLEVYNHVAVNDDRLLGCLG